MVPPEINGFQFVNEERARSKLSLNYIVDPKTYI